MVGVRGFEPPAPWSQTTCATKLRYTPSFICCLTSTTILVYYIFKNIARLFYKFFSNILNKFHLFVFFGGYICKAVHKLRCTALHKLILSKTSLLTIFHCFIQNFYPVKGFPCTYSYTFHCIFSNSSVNSGCLGY